MSLANWLRSSVAGLAGGLAWYVGLQVIFGAAQGILSNPNLQSQKMMAAFTDTQASGNPIIIVIGLLTIGLVWGWVYMAVSRAWMVVWWQRGLRFALLSWALMVPWFEFYLLWNVLREPNALVLLEMVCWAGVMTVVGLTIAGVEQVLARFNSRSIL
jgi:hypothetical protein